MWTFLSSSDLLPVGCEGGEAVVAAPLDVPGGQVHAEAVRVHVPEEVAAHRRADEPVRLLAGLGRRAAQDTVNVVLLVNLAKIEIL